MWMSDPTVEISPGASASASTPSRVFDQSLNDGGETQDLTQDSQETIPAIENDGDQGPTVEEIM